MAFCRLLILAALFLGSITGTANAWDPSTQQVVGTEGYESAVESLNNFSMDMYHQLDDSNDNAVISPYSVFTVLAMTRLGAGGETLEEMDRVLHVSPVNSDLDESLALLASRSTLSRDSSADFRLELMNTIWGQTGYPFLPEFSEAVSRYYSPEGLRELDFSINPESARDTINAWACENSSGRIRSLLPEGSITGATRMVLASGIYLRGSWAFQFDTLFTSEGPWTMLSGGVARVPMMHLSEHFDTASGDGYRAVSLPYGNTSISMLIILPDSGRFREVQGRMDAHFIGKVANDLHDTSLNLALPRFSQSLDLDLRDMLISLGMSQAFGPGADFSKMDGTMSLYISAAYHQAYISVDENGTEAAGASAVVMAKMDGEPAIDFFVDHPFIFLIRDRRTGAILFMGRVTDPSN
jgi:serpin B